MFTREIEGGGETECGETGRETAGIRPETAEVEVSDASGVKEADGAATGTRVDPEGAGTEGEPRDGKQS